MKLFKSFMILASLSLQSCYTLRSCQKGTWTKINHFRCCIGAKHDEFATLRYRGESKFLAAVKFVHRSGQIRCKNAAVHNSNWGCGFKVRDSLNVFLTDWKNHVMFPRPRYTNFSSFGGWYGLPGFNHISRVLVFSDFANPTYLYTNKRMRIWYGEDLYDHGEADNHGKVCFDVYGYLI